MHKVGQMVNDSATNKVDWQLGICQMMEACKANKFAMALSKCLNLLYVYEVIIFYLTHTVNWLILT